MTIDRELLRQQIRQELEAQDVATLIANAAERVAKTDMTVLIDSHVALSDSRQDPPTQDPLDEMVLFYHRSLKRISGGTFPTNISNTEQHSNEAELWIAQWERLMGKTIAQSKQGKHQDACDAFELLFELLEAVAQDSADTQKGWVEDLDWNKVAFAYFSSLASQTEPDAYALAVVKLLNAHASHQRESCLEKALVLATEAQQDALERYVS